MRCTCISFYFFAACFSDGTTCTGRSRPGTDAIDCCTDGAIEGYTDGSSFCLDCLLSGEQFGALVLVPVLVT